MSLPTAKNICILIAFVLVVFSPCLKAGFINFDDDGSILSNAALQDLSLHSIGQIFIQTLNGNYVPLTTLSFAVEKYFFGFNPFVFHLDNLLLYVGVVILVLLLAGRMGLSNGAAFFAALIFAIHPMKVESVAWVTERKDVLYALFYLLALHQYWSYLQTSSRKHYLTTIFWGLLSILAKPMALSLPLILLVFDWFYGRSLSKRVLIEKIPIVLYVVGIAWISYALNAHNLYGGITPQGVLIWVWSLVFYLWKFLFPFFVYPYYVLPHPVSILYWPYFLSVLVFMVLIFLLVKFHRHKLFIFAFLYFICSIFFLLRTGESNFTMVSDRFMFMPSLGICFFIGAWVDKQIKSRRGIILFYILLVLIGVRTSLQVSVWHDSKSFWNELIHDYPNFYLAYNNRGTVFYQEGQDGLALRDYSRAILLNPKAAKAYLNRSLLKEEHKDYRGALEDALRAKKSGGIVEDVYLKRLYDRIKSL